MTQLKDAILATIDEGGSALRALDIAKILEIRSQFGDAGAGDPIESALAELVKEGRVRWYGREPDRVYYTNPIQLK